MLWLDHHMLPAAAGMYCIMYCTVCVYSVRSTPYIRMYILCTCVRSAVCTYIPAAHGSARVNRGDIFTAAIFGRPLMTSTSVKKQYICERRGYTDIFLCVMAVLLETSAGDLVIDLLVDQAPKLCEKLVTTLPFLSLPAFTCRCLPVANI